MSKEMSEVKQKELEEMARQEAEDKKRMAIDRCPHCGSYVKDFVYFHPVLMHMGLFICNTCGVVFAPLSIREGIMKHKYDQEASPLIVPK